METQNYPSSFTRDNIYILFFYPPDILLFDSTGLGEEILEGHRRSLASVGIDDVGGDDIVDGVLRRRSCDSNNGVGWRGRWCGGGVGGDEEIIWYTCCRDLKW